MAHTAIYRFVIARSYSESSDWFSLPAIGSANDYLAQDLQLLAAWETSQTTQTNVAFLSVMNLLGTLRCSIRGDEATACQHPEEDLYQSPTYATVCSILLVLQLVALLDHARRDTLAARSRIVKVLRLFLDDLPSEFAAQGLMTLQPPGINASLVLKIVQQVLPLLQQAMTHQCSHAVLGHPVPDAQLAPSHLVADELVRQGRL